MSEPAAVVCYGELGVDNIIQVPHLPSPERAAFPTGDSYHIGGAAANSAVWLACWGVATRLLGNAIGADDLGGRLLAWLRRYPQLDLRFLQVREGVRTPFCRILVTPDAERTILVFGYRQTPITPLSSQALQGARFLLLDLYGGAERLAAARLARELGVGVVVSDVLQPDHPVLPLTDIAILSGAYLRESLPSVEVRQHARRLQAVSGGVVIVTDGPRPVHCLDRQRRELTLTPPPVQPLDTTGAGDAFRAGLVYGLLQGWDLAASLALAAAAGALKVTCLGGASQVPPLEQVQQLAAGLKVRRSKGAGHG